MTLVVRRATDDDAHLDRVLQNLGPFSEIDDVDVAQITRTKGDTRLYLVQETTAVVGVAALTPGHAPGQSQRPHYRLRIAIDPRRISEGRALLERVVRDLPRSSLVHTETTHHASLLESCNFELRKTNRHLALDLVTWRLDSDDHEGNTYRLLPYTHLDDDTARLAALHTLITTTLADVPRALPRPSWNFEQFLHHRRTSRDLLPQLSFIAEDSGELVGFTELKLHPREPGALLSSLTGVQPGHRGRGLSSHLKRMALQAARDAGYRTVWTQNAASNHAMLRVNQALGFKTSHETYEYVGSQEHL